MLTYRRTSLLESPAQTLVNTVNCVGVMGKGLAKAFRERDPEMFEAYRSICDRGLLQPGKLWLWQGAKGWVLNFPTKLHWRQPSRLEWIEAGLRKFVAEYKHRGIREVSFPRLGCGNGGLDWSEVRPMMERHLLDLDIPVYLHDHSIDIEVPEHLENLSRLLLAESPDITSFEGFLAALRHIAKLGEGRLVDLWTGATFTASLDDEGLAITAGSTETRLSLEEVRELWLRLRAGIVTGPVRSDDMSGGAVLALLSILPQARPIEIQSPFGHREVAVELHELREKLAAADFDRQFEMSWG